MVLQSSILKSLEKDLEQVALLDMNVQSRINESQRGIVSVRESVAALEKRYSLTEETTSKWKDIVSERAAKEEAILSKMDSENSELARTAQLLKRTREDQAALASRLESTVSESAIRRDEVVAERRMIERLVEQRDQFAKALLDIVAEVSAIDRRLSEVGEDLVTMGARRGRLLNRKRVAESQIKRYQVDMQMTTGSIENLTRNSMTKLRAALSEGLVVANNTSRELESQVEQLKSMDSERARLTSEREAMNRRVEEALKTLASQTKALEDEETRLSEVRARISSSLTAEKEAERMLSDSLTSYSDLEKRRVKLRQSAVDAQSSLSHEEAEVKVLEAHCVLVKSLTSGANAKLEQATADEKRQQETLYGVQYECQAVMRRMAALTGSDANLEVRQALETRLAELEEAVKSARGITSVLAAQLLAQSNKRQKLEREAARWKKFRDSTFVVVKEMELESANMARECAASEKSRVALLMQQDSLMFALSKEKDLYEEAGRTYLDAFDNLDSVRKDFSAKLQECKRQSDLLTSVTKQLREARHVLTMHLGERTRFAKALEARLITLKAARKFSFELGNDAAEEVSVTSMTHAAILVRIVQEKELLSRAVKEREAEVAVRVVELKCLSNSLNLLNQQNSAARSNRMKAKASQKGENWPKSTVAVSLPTAMNPGVWNQIRDAETRLRASANDYHKEKQNLGAAKATLANLRTALGSLSDINYTLVASESRERLSKATRNVKTESTCFGFVPALSALVMCNSSSPQSPATQFASNALAHYGLTF